MEQSSQHNQAVPSSPLTLEGQLREMYGRAAYTHKTHEKMADGYVRRYRHIKTTEIVLSALAASSLVIAVFGDSRLGTIVGAVLSTILLGLTLYFKEASLGEQAQKHTAVASKLWGVREALLSLLVDMQDGRLVEEIRQERDRLNAQLEEIYKAAPRTDGHAYAAAQKALKNTEELFFSEDELDKMLPKPLRSKLS
ncbi:SLATT domain-containing protein [Burkholderia pseudomallei]|uniref:SLATT domain-containing protein n=1 Tax=Burkholderia pseudomallei TaxID=28450 RepID=UPI00201ACCB0|nr:SLATT domain-containing protein [Burkholderia pseudomallei]MCL4670366.1 SLATT domain-containing protein [Burkholderia pseudomallei]